MNRTIAAREVRQISLQQMKILNTVIKPKSQHPCHFSEGRWVSRMSRHIVWRPYALSLGASGLSHKIFLPFQDTAKMRCAILCSGFEVEKSQNFYRYL